jgi:hypothetical protein
MPMRIVLAAAIAAAMLVLPSVPVNAATLSDTQKDCLFFPMLKKACWELGAEHAADAGMAVSAAASEVKVPVRWWNCTRAPEGAGYMYEC